MVGLRFGPWASGCCVFTVGAHLPQGSRLQGEQWRAVRRQKPSVAEFAGSSRGSSPGTLPATLFSPYYQMRKLRSQEVTWGGLGPGEGGTALVARVGLCPEGGCGRRDCTSCHQIAVLGPPGQPQMDTPTPAPSSPRGPLPARPADSPGSPLGPGSPSWPSFPGVPGMPGIPGIP